MLIKRKWHLFHDGTETLNNASKRTGPWESCPPKHGRTCEKMKEPLRRYGINQLNQCQSSFKMRSWVRTSLKELPGTAEPPKEPSRTPACDAWWGMHWQKLSDLGVLIWNVQVSTCRTLQSLDVKRSEIFPSFLVFPSCPVKCYVYDSWSSCIDPRWDPLMFFLDPLLTHSGSTVHSGKPLLIPSFFQGLQKSEVPTHFLQEPLDGSILGMLVRHQHHLRLRLFDGLQMTTCFLKLPKFHVIRCNIRRINFNRGTTRRICTAASLEACDDLRFLDPNHLSSYADIWRTSGSQRNQDLFWNEGIAALDETVYYMSNKLKRSLQTDMHIFIPHAKETWKNMSHETSILGLHRHAVPALYPSWSRVCQQLQVWWKSRPFGGNIELKQLQSLFPLEKYGFSELNWGRNTSKYINKW